MYFLFGLNISWWVYLLGVILWFLYLKMGKWNWLVLVFLFFLNLYINHLFTLKGFNFDWEKINITNPKYLGMIEKYRYDDVIMPYRLRMIFYQSWLMIFYWLDSTFKILSPLFWVRILGFSGILVTSWGIYKIKFNQILWFLTVVFSSGLGIMTDTKTSIFLTLPVIIILICNGIINIYFKKYWGLVLLLVIVDLILK